LNSTKTHIYFASDFHLGAPDWESSLLREKKIIAWLNEIEKDAAEIYFLGDVFDFWFEYKEVVPKGFIRLLGKFASLSDAGIKLHFFTGNHDMWIFDYFKKEFNAQIYHQPMLRKINQKVFFIGHGDGLGPGDLKYKIIKKFFRSKVCQWTFARFHPNFGIGIANYFSRKSRATNGKNDEKFLGKENEWLYLYSKEIAKKEKIDYFVFGHRHLPIELPIDQSTYYNLGEWISYCTFGQFDGEDFHMKSWVDGKVQPFIFNENN
jgi:UDP-2,3-diacylglucosamine hydrolase